MIGEVHSWINSISLIACTLFMMAMMMMMLMAIKEQQGTVPSLPPRFSKTGKEHSRPQPPRFSNIQTTLSAPSHTPRPNAMAAKTRWCHASHMIAKEERTISPFGFSFRRRGYSGAVGLPGASLNGSDNRAGHVVWANQLQDLGDGHFSPFPKNPLQWSNDAATGTW